MKRIVLLLLAALTAAALAAPAHAAEAIQPTRQALTVDGAAVQGCEIYNIEGSNYFKLRDVAYLLKDGASRFSVAWDGQTRSVTVVSGADYVPDGSELQLRTLSHSELRAAGRSSQRIYINGKADSTLTAYLIGGNNFFKLRDLGTALGFGVDYDTKSNTVLVTSRSAAAPGQAATAARLGETPDAGRAYLDKIIFLGDSTTYGIRAYYDMGYKDLCPRQQVWTPTSGWMSLRQYDTAKIFYHETGEELLIKDAAAKAKPEIMVITMGIDSIAVESRESFIDYYTALVRDIQAASPETKIILNSIYPVAKSYKYQRDINNDKICAANEWIEGIAVSTGCRFLYTWEALAENGVLPETAHNGDGLHPNGETYGKVMQYIRTHAIA